MCSSKEKSKYDLPGSVPKGSFLIDGLVLFQSGPTLKIVLDQTESGEVRSETVKYRLFHQTDDGFAFIGSCGQRYGAFSGSEVPYHDRLAARRPHKWQNRAIISVKVLSVILFLSLVTGGCTTGQT